MKFCQKEICRKLSEVLLKSFRLQRMKVHAKQDNFPITSFCFLLAHPTDKNMARECCEIFK